MNGTDAPTYKSYWGTYLHCASGHFANVQGPLESTTLCSMFCCQADDTLLAFGLHVMPFQYIYCRSNAQHLVASRKEHWYNQTFGGFLFVEKVEVVLRIHFWTCEHTQLEVDDKAVAVPDPLISRVLEPCKLQPLLLLCLQKPSPWIAAVGRLP